MLEAEENPFADPVGNRRGGGRGRNTAPVQPAGSANLPAGNAANAPAPISDNNTTRPTVAAFDKFVNSMTASSAASTPSSPHSAVPRIASERFRDARLEIVNKIEVSQEATVNKAILLPSSTREDGIICCGEDRTIRVYLRRESGIFWPSVCTYASAPIATLTFNAETRRVFCGLANGNILEYLLAPDFNSLHLKKQITGTHTKRVIELVFSLPCEWIVSIAKDRLLAWHCSETGQRTGCLTMSDQPTCFCFDQATKHVFVGDESGSIQMLRLGDAGDHQLITKFSGHSAGITALCWHPVAEMLFSGGSDRLVVAWDIGSKQGIVYELSGHSGRIVGLNYAAVTKQLFAVDESGLVGVWDMVRGVRNETPQWIDADECQLCNSPFFWNWREMWQRKTVGLRQHHCRLCGIAVCQRCSLHATPLPRLGFERAVRICDRCNDKLFGGGSGNADDFAKIINLSSIIPVLPGGGRTPANSGAVTAAAGAVVNRSTASNAAAGSSSAGMSTSTASLKNNISLKEFLEPLAYFQDAQHTVICADFDESSNRTRLLTLGIDRAVRLWNASQVMSASLGGGA